MRKTSQTQQFSSIGDLEEGEWSNYRGHDNQQLHLLKLGLFDHVIITPTTDFGIASNTSVYLIPQKLPPGSTSIFNWSILTRPPFSTTFRLSIDSQLAETNHGLIYFSLTLSTDATPLFESRWCPYLSKQGYLTRLTTLQATPHSTHDFPQKFVICVTSSSICLDPLINTSDFSGLLSGSFSFMVCSAPKFI